MEENPILEMLHLEAACILLVGPTLKKFNDRGTFNFHFFHPIGLTSPLNGLLFLLFCIAISTLWLHSMSVISSNHPSMPVFSKRHLFLVNFNGSPF